jgi:hypothetical protein
MSAYPKYLVFSDFNRQPSCTAMFFQAEVEIESGKNFYPVSDVFKPYFSTERDIQRFGAALYLGFLHDVISVEHSIVIPAIRDLHFLQIKIPPKPLEELYKLVTDEGHHAAQAMALLNAMQDKFDLAAYEKGCEVPLFLRKLYAHMQELSTDMDRAIFNLCVGVESEARMPKELGPFTNADTINSAVVEFSRTHQDDESIHASQFRALAKWSWSQFNDAQRETAARVYAEATVAKRYPDIEKLGFHFSQASGIGREESRKILSDIYPEDALVEQMKVAAKPSIVLLRNIGVLEYPSARDVLTRAGIDLNS